MMSSLITWTFWSSGSVLLANLQPAGPGTQPGGVALFPKCRGPHHEAAVI
jgi:hypothetical protein